MKFPTGNLLFLLFHKYSLVALISEFIKSSVALRLVFNYSYIHKMFILISLIKIKFCMGNLPFLLFHKYYLVAMSSALIAYYHNDKHIEHELRVCILYF